MKKVLFLILAMTLVFSVGAMAQNNGPVNGTLGVNANLQSSIYLTLEQATGGPALASGAGTPAAVLSLGNVSAYGPAPGSGITRTLNGSPYVTSFTLATSFGVRVGMYNTNGKTGYGLTAALASGDASNTWTVDGVTLSTTAQAVNPGTAFGDVEAHALTLQIPQNLSAGAISNTINLAATAQ
jgi:hypothetical protein